MMDSNTTQPASPQPAAQCDRSQGDTQDDPDCVKPDRGIPSNPADTPRQAAEVTDD